jgi:hypothetical protein
MINILFHFSPACTQNIHSFSTVGNRTNDLLNITPQSMVVKHPVYVLNGKNGIYSLHLSLFIWTYSLLNLTSNVKCVIM